ncbi:MAG TPA: protein kinase [Vicinamibacterales bacterium]|nr:protein kinase [Vicinamibacterales bacterium]
MTLAPGVRLGAYEILAPIGAGGMGEVYKARDTRLRREVALKVLPDALALDRDRLARFTREAQTLASLNHPNIAQIFGLEDASAATPGRPAVHALAMELVAGSTLEHLLASGSHRLDTGRAVAIARQIADALAAAHEKAIIHRDLKPGNVMVTADGTVKVLDFGLAKALAPEGAGEAEGGLNTPAPFAESPTLTSPAMTAHGVLLGTAAYMSPEQACGRPVDARTDVWAFGCVLYEMLAGRRAFAAPTVTDTLASVLRDEPDWTRLPAGLPPAIRWIIERCLQKDVRRRLQHLGDVRLMLDDERFAMDLTAQAAAARQAGRRVASRTGWVAAGLATLALAGTGSVAWRHWQEAPYASKPVHFTVHPPEGMTFSQQLQLAVSPDGTQIAFTAAIGAVSTLWVRPTQSLTARSLAGTEGATLPFWSPDSRSIGFFSGGKLQIVGIDGGLPRLVCTVATGRGGTWNGDGVIVFAHGPDSPLLRVDAAGGTPTPVTQLDPPRENSHRMPSFLPDGRRFVFLAGGQAPAGGIGWQIKLGSLDSPGTTKIVDAAIGSSPVVSAGHLLFSRDESLMALAFDANRGIATGAPFAVANQPFSTSYASRASFSASSDGLLAFMAPADASRRLVWIDRAGGQTLVPGEAAVYLGVSLSPDERRAAASIEVSRPTTRDIWAIDLADGRRSRLTVDPTDDNNPLWSPDGAVVHYSSSRNGAANLFRRSADGKGPEELLQPSDRSQVATDLSTDGRLLIYTQATETGSDIWALPLTGDRKPVPLLQGPSVKTNGTLSPDRRWLAYQSNESGRDEVYVQAYPGAGRSERVSPNGGSSPRWRADGKELFYIEAGSLMAVPVDASGAPAAAAARALFPMPVLQATGAQQLSIYDVSRDGQRFLTMVADSVPDTRPFIVMTDWRSAIR